MKPRSPAYPNRTKKKAEQAVKQPGRGKVWVNPKSPLKNQCEHAWSEAEVPSPKFIDMGQIDLRTKTVPKPAMVKAAAAGKPRTSTKAPRP